MSKSNFAPVKVTAKVYDYIQQKWVTVLKSSGLIRITEVEQQAHIINEAK